MSRPTVTIITCTYNSIKFIDDCVKSVINQDYKHIEYLFIDGKSNDGTLEYLRNVSKTHDHIRIISEKDNGVYFAFNRGVKESKGKIIGFLPLMIFFLVIVLFQKLLINFTIPMRWSIRRFTIC